MINFETPNGSRRGWCHRCLVPVGLAPVVTAMTCLHCKRPVGTKGKSRGLCDPHFRRFMRYGNVFGRPEAYQVTQGFKGLGLIKCAACGEPCRDHSLTEPCAMADIR